MEVWIALLGSPKQTVYPQIGHLWITDKAQGWEIPQKKNNVSTTKLHCYEHSPSAICIITHFTIPWRTEAE